MRNVAIQKSTLDFLRNLAVHNDRNWFAAHTEHYEQARENAQEFLTALISRMSTHDQIEFPAGKKGLYRIYNDVRFSKDKSPYNARFAGYIRRAKPMFRGGYYIWIKPGACRIGCGFSGPNPEDLKRIRQDIAVNYEDWHKVLNSKTLKSTFGTLRGDQVKSAPRGFPRDHPAIDLLRYKQFWFEHTFSDKEVLSRGYLEKVNRTFKTIRPFFDYMSEVLTTDLNGELIVGKGLG